MVEVVDYNVATAQLSFVLNSYYLWKVILYITLMQCFIFKHIDNFLLSNSFCFYITQSKGFLLIKTGTREINHKLSHWDHIPQDTVAWIKVGLVCVFSQLQTVEWKLNVTIYYNWIKIKPLIYL